MIRLDLELVEEALGALIGAAGMLEDATIGLFTNDVDFDSPVVAGDFVAPTFTGYAASAAVTWTIFTDANGNRYAESGTIAFTPTDGANLPQQIKGAWVRELTSNDFLAGGLFEEPLTLAVADQSMHVTVRVPIETKQPTLVIEGNVI